MKWKRETWNNSQQMVIDELRREILDLEKKYAMLLEKTPPSTEEYASRIADLEVKMAKLWTVLIKIDERGNDRASKYARKMFGGKAF